MYNTWVVHHQDMPKFILRAIDEDGTVSVKQFESLYLPDVVEKTEDFLRGVGFVFDRLDTVNDEEVEESSPVYLKESFRYRASD